MCRYLAVLEYDGTGFYGSQIQRGQRTVQGELESALARLDGRPVSTVFAGRTDSGVHAQGQVAAFDLGKRREPAEVAEALCGLMPADVGARVVAEAPAEFSPRYWAERRRYCYRLIVSRARSPLRERYAYRMSTELDLEAAGRLAETYLGRHDFGAFGQSPQGGGTERTLFRLELIREGECIEVVVEADAFLRRMVRRLVGTLVDVGRHKTDWREAARAVNSGALDRSSVVGPALPAHGLTLEGVAYDRQRLGLGTGRWWSSEPLVGGTDVTLAIGVRQ